MNLSLPFLGGTSGGGIVLSSEIFYTTEITNDVSVELVVDNTTTENVVNNHIFVDNHIASSGNNTSSTPVVSLCVDTYNKSIDNHFNILIEMLKGEGFPIYLGEISAHNSEAPELSLSAMITEQPTAYMSNEIYPASNNYTDIHIEDTIIHEDSVVNIESHFAASDAQIFIKNKIEAKNADIVFIESSNMLGQSHSLVVAANILAVDVLLECTSIPEDQIVYKISEISKNNTEGKALIYPMKWSPMSINIPLIEHGKRATVSNFIIPKLIEKYGEDIHDYISMIISRNSRTGEEYNFVISKEYTTPQGSINDFNLCVLEDSSFIASPFIIKSVSNQPISLEWKI